MKTISLLAAGAMLLAVTAPVFADDMPYFGSSPNHGSYWNSPGSDYPNGPPAGASNEAADPYAQGHCDYFRARHVTSSGKVFFSTRRVCG